MAIIGIDLGTSNSAAMVLRGGRPVIIPSAARHFQDRVTFDIDSNDILSVSARDVATGKSQSISISGSIRLSEEEKKHMVDDASRYAEADKKGVKTRKSSMQRMRHVMKLRERSPTSLTSLPIS